MKRLSILTFTGIVTLLLLVSSIFSSHAQPGGVLNAVIDFEGLAAGVIPDTLYSGYGISGDPISGYVTVEGDNPIIGDGFSAAMIFDAACPPTNTPPSCTGNDPDLFYPDMGNILIISEDLDPTDPDDADIRGSFFEFYYSDWGPGVVNVESFTVMDVEDGQSEGGATAEFYSGGEQGILLGSVEIPDTGNNGRAVVTVGLSGVDFMQITLHGSGAIDNIQVSVEMPTPPDETATVTPNVTITPVGSPTPTSTATPPPKPTNSPTPTPTEPTAIDLLYFRLDSVENQEVNLAWATIAEIDNYGFNLYRSPTADFGHAEKIAFVPAKGGLGVTTYYEYTDKAGLGDWWYWLTDVDTKGVETHHSKDQMVKASVEPVRYTNWTFIPLIVGR